MRVALCMRGAISKDKAFFCKNDLYMSSPYVDYYACYNSIIQHIISPNKKYTFDIFCHCWNTDLEDNIRQLYNPVAYCFEDNRIYNEEILKKCIHATDFGGISQALTIQKSIELKEKYERENNFQYDIVIIYRYDVLLWKDMILDDYSNLEENLYVDAHENSNGEFHFVMSSTHANMFSKLYDSIELGNRYVMHHWIKQYVIHYMKKPLRMDTLIPAVHLCNIRKIESHSIIPKHLDIAVFNSYKGTYTK